MNAEIIKSTFRQQPKTAAEKYLFLTDDIRAAENIYLAGYRSAALIVNDPAFMDEFQFTDYINSILLSGSWVTSYCFITCMKRKDDNDYLANFFDTAHLCYKEGWRLFYRREYLKKPEKVDQLKRELDKMIESYEGPGADPVQQEPKKGIQVKAAADIMEMDIPPIHWLVDNILPDGLAMLGAPSKTFKSYMAIHLCLCIAEGLPFLGRKTEKAACLYCDLESTVRRPRDRMRQVLAGRKAPDNFYIITANDDLDAIGAGFEDQIEDILKQHPEIGLIVIDVFQMIRQAAKRNQTGYDRDYDDFKVIKRIADRHEICILLIHHTRKMRDPSDVFNELSGSVGVMGALDCAWVITREERFQDEATLNITGRDMESQQFKIRFNKKTFKWEYIGTSEEVALQRLREEYENSPITETIKKLIKQGGGSWEGSAKEIRDAGQYLSRVIYDDVRNIGVFITNHEIFFGFDDISIEYTRESNSSRTRKYVFKSCPKCPT